MEITEYHKAPKVPVEFEAKKLCSNSQCDIIHLILKPGKVLERYIDHSDNVFFVIKGMGIFEYAENKYIVNENTCIQIESKTERSWINSGNEDLVLLVIKFK